MIISYKTHKLELALPFKISKGTYKAREVLIVSLSQGGHTGYGEATAITYYGQSIDMWKSKLELVKSRLSSIPLTDPKIYYQKLQPLLGDVPFLLSAFDCAAYDLFGKIHQRPVHEIIGANISTNLAITSYTIGLDSVQAMQEKILDKPWPVYKIKLGVENDLDILKQLRTITKAPFRIDVNEGWTLDTTKYNLPILKALDVELIEQPVKRAADDQLGLISATSHIPFIADESCQNAEDIERCKESYHGINIKLMKCGGITPALEMIRLARSYHLRIMIGCMTESTIGISAGAQLVPFVDYVDLDGTLLIKKDLAQGLTIKSGHIHYPDLPGLGFNMLNP